MTIGKVSALFTLLLGICVHAFAATGQLKGGEVYTLPPWFKSSFLDFQADAEDAGERGRHLMLFMHLDEFPYCSRMLDENFFAGDNQPFIQSHFDVIGVNIRGGLEIAWVDGETYTERALSRKLRVVATSAIVFLDAEGTRVLQLNGYRDPRALRYALEYVQAGLYREQPFGDYLAGIEKPPVYEFRDHPLFSPVNYVKGYGEPLAILFEDRGCVECARFHETTLGRPEVMEEMENFLFVRLDTDSDRPIVDPEGRTLTAAEWARALDLTYRPALALFNEGRLLYRVDGRLYHQHFREALRYAGGAYRDFDSLSAFKAAFRQQQLESGVDVDFGE